MPFTEEERARWHEEKLRRERRPAATYMSPPAATCIHCHNPFGISEGVITPEVAICDVCNGD